MFSQSELYTISNTTQSLGQHIPEIRIEAEQENGTFSPDQALSPNGTNAQSHHDVGPYSESDLMLTENGSSRQWQNAVLDSQATSANGVLVTPEQYHGYTNAVLEPTDHSMCEAIVLEGFQGITGKVTSV